MPLRCVERSEDPVVVGPGRTTIATLAWFLAAARTIDGPPMSISSMSSSTVDAGPLERVCERIEVDDDEVERRDGGLGKLVTVLGQASVGQDPGVDPRVEGLDPAVEHLREPGHGRDVGDRQSGVAQRARRAARRDELEAARDEAARKVDEAGLVGDRQEGASRRRRARRRGCRRGPRATVEGRSRCSTAWIRSWSARSSSPAMTGTASWARIGPASRSAVTTWTVHPVTRTPAREGVANGMRARERRQEARMDVEDPARVRRQDLGTDEAHVAGQDDEVGPSAGEHVSEGLRPCRRARRRSRAPLRRPRRSPGSRGRRRRGRVAPPSSPRPAAAARARRFEPAPETPTAIRPWAGVQRRRSPVAEHLERPLDVA